MIGEDFFVAIIDTDPVVPVYHHLGRVTATSDYGHPYQYYTACGRVWLGPTHPWGARLRRDHADHFAMPCRRCWPPARDG